MHMPPKTEKIYLPRLEAPLLLLLPPRLGLLPLGFPPPGCRLAISWALHLELGEDVPLATRGHDCKGLGKRLDLQHPGPRSGRLKVHALQHQHCKRWQGLQLSAGACVCVRNFSLFDLFIRPVGTAGHQLCLTT